MRKIAILSIFILSLFAVNMAFSVEQPEMKVYVADINAGSATVTEEDLWICDVNRDGKITSVDSSIILCYYADLAAGYEGTFVDYLVEKIGVERSSVEDQ